jgi:hypothetical protein
MTFAGSFRARRGRGSALARRRPGVAHDRLCGAGRRAHPRSAGTASSRPQEVRPPSSVGRAGVTVDCQYPP